MLKALIFGALFFFVLSPPLWAHDFWAGESKAEDSGSRGFYFGYGHTFPQGDAIDGAKYAERFLPVRLIGEKGEIALTQGTEPRLFMAPGPLEPGTYIEVVANRDAFWSQGPDGAVRRNKKEAPGVTGCHFGSHSGKRIIKVGEGESGSFYATAVGLKLEMVPQKDPSALKVGEPFPVLVLFDGKPLPRAEVRAFFAGFTPRNSALAFLARTDREGIVNIIPLAPGEWLAKTKNAGAYEDPSVCDEWSYGTSLSFWVNE
ncbi:MAG: DUF4198 domain-containing protein [Deltaproteobacteria bacterium]|jgi:uncharacterized GH25 family protein|nr:DUF4198 domain-containing protein [Deltaproteobacteria bacterium]